VPSIATTELVVSAGGVLPSSPPSSPSSFASPAQQRPVQSLKHSFDQPTTMAATLTEALGLGVNGSFTAAAADALSSMGNNSHNLDLTATSPTRAVSAAEVATNTEGEGVPVSKNDSFQALQAQLMSREDEALHRMVSGMGADVPASNSIAIPLPSLTGSAGDARSADESRGDGGSLHDADRRAVTTVSAPPSSSSSAEAVGNAAKTSSSSATAANAAYALLEPHDVFLTHMVRSPAKADSILRAAMEGTALRYLFQASLTSTSTGI
jgi:hypothetical protein